MLSEAGARNTLVALYNPKSLAINGLQLRQTQQTEIRDNIHAKTPKE